MTQYAYCEVCKKEVDKPARKPLKTSQKVGWAIASVATIGIGAIVYAFYTANRPKTHCPTCLSQLQFSEKPFEKEQEEEEGIPLTAKEKILKKAKKEIKPRKKEAKVNVVEEGEERVSVEKTFCPYCGEDIEPNAVRCPYCHSTLKAPYEK